MRNTLLTLLSSLLLLGTAYGDEAELAKATISPPWMSEDLVPLTPGEGVERFLKSTYRGDFWYLFRYYDTQYTDTYCGVASSIMVLNALHIERPEGERIGGYRLFIQEEHFFTPEVNKIVSSDVVKLIGMTIEELSAALTTFGVKSSYYYGNTMDEQDFRDLLKISLEDPNTFLIANYHRPTIGQEGGGHFSPIAAYDEASDSVLILDVSRYKYPPIWVKINKFLLSMQVVEKGRGLPRGIISVSCNKN
jgi:hypothetical protein